MTTASKPEETSRTPSPPQGGSAEDSAMGGNSSEVDVPSPLPASTASSSSEPSQSHPPAPPPSSGYGVPNPFAAAATPAPPPPPHSAWGSHAHPTGAPAPPPPPQHYTHAPPPQHYHHHPPPPPVHHHPHPHHPVPMVVSAPRAPVPAPAPPSYHHHANAWARENSCPNFSIGTTDPKSPGGTPRNVAKGGGRRRSYSKAGGSTASAVGTTTTATDNCSGVEGGVNSRRQKRLERNRESARLSRRRRKHYLEILEERVTQLSTEVDEGRRAHAAQAVAVTLNKRREVLEAPDKTDDEKMRLLDAGLGRTSPEMMLVSTFKYQQLKSFSLPAHSKFILWLTLQNDQYFRGGRAASERLSAARIGERMLNSGNDRVPPAQSMWPLFCNEVGLSYDQEERVRSFQRTLLQTHESWLERHTARAADVAMEAAHDSTQAMSLRLSQREKSMHSVLTAEQKVKLLAWTEKNRERLQGLMQAKVTKHMAARQSAFVDDRFKIDKRQHVAANLYTLHYRLQRVMQVFPRAAPLVTGPTLKKLSRRPSFESLGRSPKDVPGKEGEDGLSKSQSFASSGSLQRSTSTLSMDGERPQMLQISPDDAEETCRPTVEKVLGHLHEIIPPTPPIQYAVHPAHPPVQQQHHQPQEPQQQQVMEFRIPSPTQVTSAHYYPQPQLQPQYAPQAVAPAPAYHHPGAPAPAYAPQPITYAPAPAPGPVPMSIVSTNPAAPPPTQHPAKDAPTHGRQSSFIPPYLNVVPEEMFPNDGTADDFLMSLVDEDWAIGEGIDMDTAE